MKLGLIFLQISVLLCLSLSCKRERTARFTGFITNPDGTPVSGASVYLCGNGDMFKCLIYKSEKADADGYYEIEYEPSFGHVELYGTFAKKAYLKSIETKMFQPEETYKGINQNLTIPNSRFLKLRLKSQNNDENITGIQLIDYYLEGERQIYNNEQFPVIEWNNFNLRIDHVLDTTVILPIVYISGKDLSLAYKRIYSNKEEQWHQHESIDSIDFKLNNDTIFHTLVY